MSLLKRILKKIVRKIYYPKDIIKNRVVFESKGPYDNSYTMFLYTVKNRPDLESYFYCPDYVIKGSNLSKKIKRYSIKGKGRVGRFLAGYRINGLIYGAETIFSSYFLIKSTNKNTTYIYVGHGIGIKAVKRYLDKILATGCDIVYPSNESKTIFNSFYKHANNKIIICGMPRTDEIVFDEKKVDSFKKMCCAKDGEKIVLMMLTFRRIKDGSFDKKYLLPQFIDLKKLNSYLKDNNVRLVVKLHHVLDNYNLEHYANLSNIEFLKNKTLFEYNFNTVSIIPFFDAFLTDYSSAATDFMLANKQIGFLTNDLNDFKGVDQGFIVKDPVLFLPGEHINNFKELCNFLKNVSTSNDNYISERARVSMILNGFTTPPLNCSKKLIDIYYPLSKPNNQNQ